MPIRYIQVNVVLRCRHRVFLYARRGWVGCPRLKRKPMRDATFFCCVCVGCQLDAKENEAFFYYFCINTPVCAAVGIHLLEPTADDKGKCICVRQHSVSRTIVYYDER